LAGTFEKLVNTIVKAAVYLHTLQAIETIKFENVFFLNLKL